MDPEGFNKEYPEPRALADLIGLKLEQFLLDQIWSTLDCNPACWAVGKVDGLGCTGPAVDPFDWSVSMLYSC